MERIRTPLLILAIVIAAIVVIFEIGSASKVGLTEGSSANGLSVSPPGKGIPYLSLLDGLVLYTALLVGAALIVPEKIQGRLQGLVSLCVGLLVLITSFFQALSALALLIVMVLLLLAFPFGTIVYFAMYGHFDVGNARIALSLLTTFKLGFVIFLVFAHQRFLQNKGLLLIVLTSLLANLVVSFLQALVPSPLVSITDTVGAIIVAVLAIIWAVFFLVGSLGSIFKAIV